MKPAAYAKLRADFEKAEEKLMRAARKWDKLRVRVRRADAQADKELIRRSAPEADLRDFPVEGSRSPLMRKRIVRGAPYYPDVAGPRK